VWWYVLQVAGAPWWLPVNNTDWKQPFGPGSSIDDMSVSLHISYAVIIDVHLREIVYLTESLNLLFIRDMEICFVTSIYVKYSVL